MPICTHSAPRCPCRRCRQRSWLPPPRRSPASYPLASAGRWLSWCRTSRRYSPRRSHAAWALSESGVTVCSSRYMSRVVAREDTFFSTRVESSVALLHLPKVRSRYGGARPEPPQTGRCQFRRLLRGVGCWAESVEGSSGAAPSAAQVSTVLALDVGIMLSQFLMPVSAAEGCQIAKYFVL